MTLIWTKIVTLVHRFVIRIKIDRSDLRRMDGQTVGVTIACLLFTDLFSVNRLIFARSTFTFSNKKHMEKRVDCVGEIARLNLFSFTEQHPTQKEPNIFAINHLLYFYYIYFTFAFGWNRTHKHIHTATCFQFYFMILMKILFSDRLPNAFRTTHLSNIRDYHILTTTKNICLYNILGLSAPNLSNGCTLISSQMAWIIASERDTLRISWINDFMLVCLLICSVLCRRQITLFLLIIAITHRSKLHMHVCKFRARQSSCCWL